MIDDKSGAGIAAIALVTYEVLASDSVAAATSESVAITVAVDARLARSRAFVIRLPLLLLEEQTYRRPIDSQLMLD